MDHEQDTPEVGAVDHDGTLDPRSAASLLEEATRRAERQFDYWPPYLLLIGAVIFLVAYGAAWWSVRGQHPYVGPSGGALAVIYGGIAVWTVVVRIVYGRATSGVGGHSAHVRRTYQAAYGAILVAYVTFQIALYHAGAGHAIVYGIYPASIPWLFAGAVFVSIGATREEGRSTVLGVALIAIGLAAAFAGPRSAWLVSGISLFAVLAGFAAHQAAKRHS